MYAIYGRLFLLAAFAASPGAALACHNGCTGGSSGGVPLPAPAGVALFALGATLLLTRRRTG